MSDGRSDPASELMLLREVVRRPLDYGLDHRHACLTSVLEFSTRNPRCVRDSEASARQKIERCLEGSRSRPSDPRPIERQIRGQLLEVKQDLAWTELDHLLGIDSRYWNEDRYARLAKSLCVLAVLWRYQRQRFPQAPAFASSAAAARLAQLWQLRQRGWKALQDHLNRSGLDWRAGMTAHLQETNHSFRGALERTGKTVCRDQDGNTWMIKYEPEGLMNPVLASIFTRLSGCPGAEVCPSFLDYDRRAKRPCSVQPYISARPLRRRITYASHRLSRLIDGDRRRASQILCQAVAQWILENIDGHQMIMDEFDNCVWVDHDRSFFIDDRHVTTDWRAAWEARSKAAVLGVSAELIKAAARIPGVLQDLAAFVARVETIPAAAFEGLVRNASFREDQLCSLFYLDAMGSHALGSIQGLERWIAHLLARKATVRRALARRLQEVLGSVEQSFDNR
jgi:hypothetical protein